MSDSAPAPLPYGPRRPRRSASAAASREAEMARLRQLTVEERIRMALSIKARHAWLQPVRQEPPP